MMATADTNNYRTTARVVGVIYLAGFIFGIGGNYLIQSVLGAPDHLAALSAKSMTLALAALLWLLTVVGEAAHGGLMFPILRPHSERMAIGYFAGRIIEASIMSVSVLFILLQIPLGAEYAKAEAGDISTLKALSTVFAQAQLYTYELGMIAIGLAGLLLCTTLYRANLVPRWLAVWGFIGYAIFFCGMVSAVMGSGLGDMASIPGGLWEVFFGIWLIVKGFNSPTIATQATGGTH